MHSAALSPVPQGQRSALVWFLEAPSIESCHCYHSGWIFSVQETMDNGGDAGTGETSVRGVSSCGSACEDASGASKTAGALAYDAMLDSPVWTSGGGDSPHLMFY